MRKFLHTHRIELVVDLSHPYAVEVSHNARRACQKPAFAMCALRAHRQERRCDLCLVAPRVLTFLQHVTGCVFFTTAVRRFLILSSVRGNNRFVYRVLPMRRAWRYCDQTQFRCATLSQSWDHVRSIECGDVSGVQADYVVMKDSGQAGGTPQKRRLADGLTSRP